MARAIYRGIVASRTYHTDVDDIVIYDPGKVEIDFMWSAGVAEILTKILDAEAPTDPGPPSAHRSGYQPTRMGEMDWDLDRVSLKPVLGFAFSSNVNFEVIATIHTYGQSGVA
jgi:hypothetical protein